MRLYSYNGILSAASTPSHATLGFHLTLTPVPAPTTNQSANQSNDSTNQRTNPQTNRINQLNQPTYSLDLLESTNSHTNNTPSQSHQPNNAHLIFLSVADSFSTLS